MRIGLVIEHFNPHRGGAEQWTYQFTERLLATGHEVHIVAGCFAESTDDMPLVRRRATTAHHYQAGRLIGRKQTARGPNCRSQTLALKIVAHKQQ